MFHVFREFPKHLAMWLDVCCGNSMHDIPGLAHLCPEQRTATGSSSCTVWLFRKPKSIPLVQSTESQYHSALHWDFRIITIQQVQQIQRLPKKGSMKPSDIWSSDFH